jgi:lipopolysaccharide export system ATP-binding protein
MLKAVHVHKAFSSKVIVNDINIEVSPGEIVSLLGPNGAGKTTSFYLIVGLIACDQGLIVLNDQDITKLSIAQRAKKGLGYLPQESSIFRALSVEDNIMSGLEMHPFLTNKERHERLSALITEFHLHPIKKLKGHLLSGGERRRTEIARTLSLEPQFILLDEPFAGVDPMAISDIKVIITYLKSKKIGILLTDHNVREALSIADRGYIMYEGTIVAQGSSDALSKDAIVKQVYLGEQFSL